jgi:TorA maturation chaperone TorD
MPDSLPKNTQRLFAHYEMADHGPTLSSGLIITKILEEGDRGDLQWLTHTYGESHLTTWLTEHGDRLLTRRSRSFWRTVLGIQDSTDPIPGESLWPL